jgi:catechol 2,3-dioxygenase-like lactoylglutathione lyase family enzyme
VLTTEKIIAFVPALDPTKARSFYAGVLGLRVINQHGFALVFEAHGTMLRVTGVQNFQPQPFTILAGREP